MSHRWTRQRPGHYTDDRGGTITKERGLWLRRGQVDGWYPSLKKAKSGSERRTWRRRSAGRWERIDGWAVVSTARRGSGGCWRVREPDGSTRDAIFRTRKTAMRRAPAIGASPKPARTKHKRGGEA